MTTQLQYATSRTNIPRPLWHRAVVVPFYYFGWTIGGGVAGAYATALSVDRLDIEWFRGTPALWVGGSLCAIGGAALAHLLRRRRWPQVVVTVLGTIATALAAWAVYDVLHSPRSFLWSFFYMITLILLAGAVATLIGGVAGIVLTRRR
jgi:hypothetical protein